LETDSFAREFISHGGKSVGALQVYARRGRKIDHNQSRECRLRENPGKNQIGDIVDVEIDQVRF
jgi:hypothetical protein